MKVRLVIVEAARGLIDPETKRRPFLDPETGRALTEANVPDTSFWRRRVAAHEIELVVDEPGAPTGREPVTPLTTR